MFRIVNDENIKDFKNFKLSEIKCKCGGKYCNGYPTGFSYELLRQLQDIRNHFGKAVIITSALRCSKHNSNVGGVKNSKHTQGKAVDFYVKGVSYKTLKSYVNTLPYNHYTYNISGSVMHHDITPPEYVEKYNLTRLLKKGVKKGDDVKELQRTLGGLKVDGLFGDKTKAKVIAYQETHKYNGKKLAVDGKVGKNTAHTLGWLYKGK